jgi:hypothetical protein
MFIHNALPLAMQAAAPVLLVLLAAVVIALIFRAITTEQTDQEPTPAQLEIQVDDWGNIRSDARKRRILSQLPEPDDERPGSDVAYPMITGLSRFILAVRLGVPFGIIAVYFGLQAGYVGKLLDFVLDHTLGPNKPDKSKGLGHGKSLGHSGLSSNDSWTQFGPLITLIIVVALLGYLVATWVNWSAVSYALDDFSFSKVEVYPALFFWKDSGPNSIELKKISFGGSEKGILGRIFGGFGTLRINVPGDEDNEYFNNIQWIPDVTEFAKKINQKWREASPDQGSETDRIITELRQIRDRLPPGD